MVVFSITLMSLLTLVVLRTDLLDDWQAQLPEDGHNHFLMDISEDQVARTLFPVGALSKRRVRELAAAHGLVTSEKKDSTGICFIGERRFKDFLQTYLPAQPGDIETPEGRVLGRHSGLMYHTLGQRQGLGIGIHRDEIDARQVRGIEQVTNGIASATAHAHHLEGGGIFLRLAGQGHGGLGSWRSVEGGGPCRHGGCRRWPTPSALIASLCESLNA
jgi:hypothetical protein